MKKAFIINGHQPYPYSEGRLNASFVERMQAHLDAGGYETRLTTMTQEFDVDREIDNHTWADVVILQTPVNWMGVSWSFKRYMDHVYSDGMDGRLSSGDGRTRSDPGKQYGSGGTLTGKKYMMSLTFNAPHESFGDPAQTFFEGKTPDDLFWPMHLNFRFLGMEPLETFACYDVMKNAQIEKDFERFDAHLKMHLPPAD